MSRFRKLPVEVDAVRWATGDKLEGLDPYGSSNLYTCQHCFHPIGAHGWIETLEGGHVVCPGDWVITGVEGEKYPCKPRIFEKTYEPVDTEEAVDVWLGLMKEASDV